MSNKKPDTALPEDMPLPSWMAERPNDIDQDEEKAAARSGDENGDASSSSNGDDQNHSDSSSVGTDTSDTDLANFRIKLNRARAAEASSPSNRPPKR